MPTTYAFLVVFCLGRMRGGGSRMMRWFSFLVIRGVVWVTRLLFADINISFSTALHRSKARLGGGFFLHFRPVSFSCAFR
jgi:hypothetical protein